MAGLATIGNRLADADRQCPARGRSIERRLYADAGKPALHRYLTRAVFEDAHKVRLANPYKTVTAKTILIATGGHPIIPDVPGKEHLISSNECFQLEALPDSIVIIGAGYISMEFASIFNGLGVHVTVLYRGDQILRDFDERSPQRARRFHAQTWHRSAHECRCRGCCEGSGWLSRQTQGRGTRLPAGLVMAATGRAPNTMGLGLEAIGVELGWNGHIVVDEFSKSSVDKIYAVGDVTHRMNLTPVAIREANDFAETVVQEHADRGRLCWHSDSGVLRS